MSYDDFDAGPTRVPLEGRIRQLREDQAHRLLVERKAPEIAREALYAGLKGDADDRAETLRRAARDKLVVLSWEELLLIVAAEMAELTHTLKEAR